MFDILAAAFLVGTALMISFVLFLGWQQMAIDRAETQADAVKKADRAAAAVAAAQAKSA